MFCHINSIYCCFHADCIVDTNSFGLDDVNYAFTAWVVVNRTTVFNVTYPVAPTGINTFVLDPMACNVSNHHHFDTAGSAAAAVALSTYINGSSPGTLLLAVTVDELYQQLFPAFSALTSLGLNLTALNTCGKFAFLAELRKPWKTVSVVASHGGSNAYPVVDVTGM